MEIYRIPEIEPEHTSYYNLLRTIFTQLQADIGDIEAIYIVNLGIQGTAQYIEQKETKEIHAIEPGVLTITNPHQEHELIIPSPEYSYITSLYSKLDVNTIIASLKEKVDYNLEYFSDPKNYEFQFHETIKKQALHINQLMEKMFQLGMHFNNQSELKLFYQLYSQEILMALIREDLFYCVKRKSWEETPNPTQSKEIVRRIYQAIEYINDNPTQAISLDTLARMSNLSKNYFIDHFKKITRQTPYQYLMARRIELAKQLLQHTQLPVYEIGFKVGFNNQTTFFRQFSKQVGIPPEQYRISKQTK